MSNAVAESKPIHPLAKLKEQFIDRQPEFNAALPAHIPVERFIRVVLTACQLNPHLLKADRASLFTSAAKAATDGLLPDGREGALVIYSTKVGDDWIDKVSWMPMIAGLRKKVRNSGEIATWDVHAVHARDKFDYELGDDPYIKHKPYIGEGDPGKTIAFYSVAVLKSGEKSRDVMSCADVEHVRDAYSKKDRKGNFSPAWVKSFDEMGKKTVARRHSKVLPMSTDLDDLLRRDDELYDLSGKSDKRLSSPAESLTERLDMLASSPATKTVDEDAGEISGEDISDNTSSGPNQTPGPAATAAGPNPTETGAASDPPSSQKTAAPDPSPTEGQRKALLSNLMAEGAARAEIGLEALNAWLAGLPDGELSLVRVSQRAAWREQAGRVKT